MTPPIERDERVWHITITSDGCPFTTYPGIIEGCLLRHYKNEEDERCTLENCRKKSKDRDKVLDILDKFVKDSIKICDESHGNLSSPSKVRGMKSALVIVEGMINQCRTDSGILLLEESESKVNGDYP